MKIILAAFLILFASLASAQNITVLADTNGTLKTPLAFTRANRLATNINASLTNITFKGPVTLPDVTADRVAGVNSFGQLTNTSMTIAGFNNLSNNIISAIGGSVTGKVAEVNGGATNLVLSGGTTNNDLTASRVMVTDANKKESSSAVTAATLAFLDATSSVQTQINGKQPLDADLTAIAAFASTGLPARTGSGTWALRTITAGSAKIAVSDGDGVAGNPTVNLGTVSYTDLSDYTSLTGKVSAYNGAATNLSIWGGTNLTLHDGASQWGSDFQVWISGTTIGFYSINNSGYYETFNNGTWTWNGIPIFNNGTASRLMATDGSKFVQTINASVTEGNYLVGVTGGIQTNINARIANQGGWGTNLSLYGITTVGGDQIIINTVMSLPALSASHVLVLGGESDVQASTVTVLELQTLIGVTGGIQTNLDARIANLGGKGTNVIINGQTNSDLTASTVPYTDANKKLVSSAVTPTELGRLTGTVVNIQTNLDWRVASYSGTATGLTVSGSATGIVQSVNGLTKNALVIAVGSTGVSPNLSTTAPDTININIPVSASGVVGVLSTTDRTTFLTVTQKVDNFSGNVTNLQSWSGFTNNDNTASRALVTDANKKYVSSVTTSAELALLSGLTYGVQTNLDWRVPNNAGNATNLVLWSGTTNQDLTASRAMATDANKKIVSSATTATELGYVNGVTAGIQPQLDSKITADPATCNGRLTLTTATPVTTADVKAAGTIYFTPYKGNRVSIYTGSGSVWSNITFAEISASLAGLNKATNWDVFAYNNSGTLALETLQWTSDTARATALTTQDGIYVKTGATDRRYLGTFRTSVVAQTEDSITNRFVWNYYNREPRHMYRQDTTANYAYTSTNYRPQHDDRANKIEIVVGVSEKPCQVYCEGFGSTSSAVPYVGIGVNSTNSNSAEIRDGTAATTVTGALYARHFWVPTVGYTVFTALEKGGTGVTLYGATGEIKTGIYAFFEQ